MANSVDQRIVNMKFDNSQFEKGVSKTINSLQKLNEKLQFKNANKGFKDLEESSNKVKFSGLLTAVDSISQKFNAMGVVGFTVFQNLTNSAINAGKQIASAFTIDPIKTGFQEYETQINAVQTILANTASKGTNLQQVNSALDELNRYADMTIYNFTEMTRNIGTFTAAGVDLDTSTQAIKGIANLAAVSGSNSQQASTAMYQLSQALAAGTVKLMDWNSVVNAGMGGQVFQDALKETARVHGIAIDDMIEKNGSFRETLQEGWLSSEILTETLAKFTGDLTEEQLRSIGYTDEQIAGIMEMGRTANDAATKVKTFTQLMDTLKEAAQSGWTQSWEIIIGDFEEAKEFLTEISDTFSEIINDSANARNEVLQGWKDLGGRTVLIDSLRNIFQGVMSIMKPVKEAFAEIFPPVTAQNLYNFTVKIKELTEILKINDETADKFKRTFKGIFSVLDIGKQIFTTVANIIGRLISKIFGMSGSFLNATASLGDFLTGLDEQIKSSGILTFVIDKATQVIDKLSNIASKVSQLVLKAFKTVTNAISSFMTMGVDFAIALGNKMAPILLGIAHKIQDVFKNIISNINLENILGVMTVGLSGGLLAVIAKFVKRLTGFVDEASEGFGLFGSIKDAISALTDTLSTLQTAVKAHSILAIAIAVGILAGSMVALASIDTQSLLRALGGLSGIFINLIGSLYALEAMDFTKGGLDLFKMAGLMISLAIAVDLLAVAVKKLSSLSFKELVKGLGSVGVLLLELAGFLKLISIGNVNTKGIGNLIFLGAAMNLLALAVKQLSKMSPEELVKGLSSIGALLLELAGFTHIVGDTKGLISTGIAMIAIGTAMNILYLAVKSFSSLSIKELAKGLGTMGAALGIIAGAMRLMPKSILANSVGLVFIATSLNVLSGALSVMGDMPVKTIAKGLFTLGASLVIIAGAMKLMRGAIPGAIALNAIALALTFLTPVLLTLGSMSLESIGKSLLVLAGTFVVLGAAASILSPVIPAMLGLSGAVALLGVGLLSAGAGVLALSIGLVALGTSGAAGIAALVAAVEAIIGLIPTAFTKIGEGIVALLNVIAGSFDSLVNAIKTVLLSILKAIIEILPTLGETIIALITTICDIIIQSAPTVGQALLVILQTLLQIIIDSIPMIVEAGVQMILAFIQGIADNMASITNAVILGIVYFIRTVSEQLHTVINAAIQMAIAFINGLADGIRNNQQPFKDAIVNLIQAVGDFIGSCIDDLIGFGGNIIDGLVRGIGEAGHRLLEALGNVVGGAVDWVKNLLGIHSPSKVFMEIAYFCIQGWVNMFDQKGHLITQAAGNTAQNSVQAFSEALSSIPETFSSDMDFFPTITPVVDLTNVNKSISDMGSMFGSPFDLDLSSTIGLSKIAMEKKDFSSTDGKSVEIVNNYDMTQNNYSPKALSRIDIYRDTKRQFSRLKGVTNV